MTRGPGRHSELNFCAAEQHYSAAEYQSIIVIIIIIIIIINLYLLKNRDENN